MPRYLPKRSENTRPHKKLYIIRNTKKVEATQISPTDKLIYNV